MFSWVPSFWTDEAASISSADRSLADIGGLISNIDAVHATYYVALHGWMSVVPLTEGGLRALSVLSIAAAGAGTWWLGRLLSGASLAWAGAVVVAVLPRVTWAGIEARPFALSIAASVWCTVMVVVAIRATRRPWAWWAGYALLGALAVSTNVYVALLILAHGVSLLLVKAPRKALLSWLLACVVMVVLSLPILLLVLSQRGQIAEYDLGPIGWLQNVFVNQWFLGAPAAGLLGAVGNGFWRPAAVAASVIGWLLVAVGVFRALRPQRRRISGPSEVGASSDGGATSGATAAGASRAGVQSLRYAVAWLLPAAAVPTIVFGVYVLAVSPSYNPRYMTFTAFAFALLIAIGIIAIDRTDAQIVVVALLIVAIAPVYMSQRQPASKAGSDYRTVAHYIQTHKVDGDGVYYVPRLASDTSFSGLTTRRIAVSYPDEFADLDDVTFFESRDETDTIDDISAGFEASQLEGLNRVWVIERIDVDDARRDSDDAILREAGFTGTEVYSGTLNTIWEYRR